MSWSRSISGLVVLVSLGGWLVSRTPTGGPSSPSRLRSEPPDLLRLREEGNRLFAAQRYEEASGIYERSYRESLDRRQIRPAIRSLNNLAGCQFALSRYQKAVELYLEAQRLARSIRYAELLGAVSLNLAGIYLQMGDAGAAAQAAEQGIRDLRELPNVYFRAKLLGQLGNARGWSGQFEEALSILSASQREADRVDDLPTLAVTLDYSGIHCLRRGDLPGAEAAFLKAYLVRKLRKPEEVHLSHANLGRLRLAQGDFKSAETLFSLALAKAGSAPSLVQIWTLYHGRGAAREARGRFDEAWADFGTAADLARRWRADAVAADALRIRTDAGLHEVYQSYIRAGNRAALSGGRPEMARRAFSAAEEHRAVSLRERWNASGEWRRKLPEEYGAVLGQLQSAEAAAVRDPSSPAAARAGRLRLRLIEMEAQTGAPPPLAVPGGRAAEFSRAIQRRLSPSEALLSFEFGEKESYLWALTGKRFFLHALGPRRELAALITRFRDAVRLGQADAADAGGELYSRLFGSLRPSVTAKARWLLVLDDALFEAPLAAAVTGRANGGPVYLAESHSLMTIPSAAALLEAGADASGGVGSLFVGVGDPVYNSADPRWTGKPEPGMLHRWGLVLVPLLRASASPQPNLELPRLVASATEIRECSRRWGARETVLLEGPAACRDRLAEALRNRPAVLHLATHVLTPEGRRDGALLALSLGPSGRPEVLTSSEIASLGAARLVVLSGCSSGTGAPLPGAGLVGLTRAWLAAGADRVVASLWPTPDDSGEIFLSFYGHITQQPRQAAEALRKAQLEMLHSGNWRRQPRYWAAYVVTGKG